MQLSSFSSYYYQTRSIQLLLAAYPPKPREDDKNITAKWRHRNHHSKFSGHLDGRVGGLLRLLL